MNTGTEDFDFSQILSSQWTTDDASGAAPQRTGCVRPEQSCMAMNGSPYWTPHQECLLQWIGFVKFSEWERLVKLSGTVGKIGHTFYKSGKD